MATWGWGRFTEVDYYEQWPTRLFDGEEEIFDWCVFVDEDKGIYKVFVREDGSKPEPGTTKTYAPFKVKDGENVVEIKRAKHKLKVFKVNS